MQTKFKRHQLVKLLNSPNPAMVESNEAENFSKVEIKKGMLGKINILLPDGKYHVEILDKKGEVIAYAPFEEDSLEAV